MCGILIIKNLAKFASFLRVCMRVCTCVRRSTCKCVHVYVKAGGQFQPLSSGTVPTSLKA